MPEYILETNGLQVDYGPARALTAVDLKVKAGDVVAVLGSNGAGKTTLARALCGLVPTSAGEIHFAGQQITRWSSQRIARAGLAYLPEGRGVFPALSVKDNLRMWTMSLPRADRSAAVERAYEFFPVLGDRRTQSAGSLSGGEQQMLSLARCFVGDPLLVIADEMSLGLAPKMVDAVFAGLARAAAQGVTIVMIEQFVHRALALATTCVVVRRGAVAWQGAAADAQEHVIGHYLGANPSEVHS